jgi:hypothetical protein
VSGGQDDPGHAERLLRGDRLIDGLVLLGGGVWRPTLNPAGRGLVAADRGAVVADDAWGREHWPERRRVGSVAAHAIVVHLPPVEQQAGWLTTDGNARSANRDQSVGRGRDGSSP